uniref:CARD domain-containing protein n=1 Tax=Amphiprion ocellaris TaxID=80972 RepID=A0A3Q1CBI1_AMPOC
IGSNPPNQKLLDVRSCFIDGTSGPVLNSLLDKLLEKKVLTDSERESADEVKNRRDKARFVIDTVRKKGDAASSEMMEFFCELDPFLCEHLDLM